MSILACATSVSACARLGVTTHGHWDYSITGITVDAGIKAPMLMTANCKEIGIYISQQALNMCTQ